MMNPVIGLDVAKGESQVQAFLDKKQPYKKSFKVAHTVEGLTTLLEFIREIEEVSGVRPLLFWNLQAIIIHQLSSFSKTEDI
ncbi:hypothetical protein SAMN05421832_1318 [Psychrobacillus psychrodurans]|nr:hypothetical protein SAMN05421832_1318 [Psychrobacillus psychrodurans]